MKFFRSLYFNNRFFLATGVIAACFVLSFILGDFIILPQVLFYIALAFLLTDFILLFRTQKGLRGHRFAPEKLSNGDENELRIYLENFYPFRIALRVIDEIPHQFQRRDISFYLNILPGENKVIKYSLRPVKRGEYSFGAVNAMVSSPIGFIARRFRFSQDKLVPVYPSYIQMRKYELLAISNRLTETGIKKIRRIGQNIEFELIKE